jgi:thermitase
MPSHAYMRTVTSVTFLTATMLFGAKTITAKEYIIKPKKHLSQYNLKSLTASTISPFKVTDYIEDLNLIKVSVSKHDDQVEPVVRATEYFDAEYVVENIMLHTLINPSDPRRAEQWALDVINAPLAWDISMGSHDVVVAIVDTGIDVTHEDLKDNIWINSDEIAGNGADDDKNGFIDDVNGWDFNGNDKDPSDETSAQNPGHGTHCAGIVGASCGNDVGVCGISPTVSLMPLRFLGSDGSGDLFAAVKAIDYAINNGAHIISASFGANVTESGAQPLTDAIKRAEDKGITFVAAAGNEGNSNDKKSIYPANTNTSNMIAVAASDRNDQKPTWSNYGRKVHLAAPGVDILSTIPGGYDDLSGTSMATPLVAGLVALMKSLDITLTGDVARSILQSTGDTVNIETESSRRINANQALQAVANKSLTLVPATYTIEPTKEFTFSAWGGVAPYHFQSANPSVATIDDNGHLVAVSAGDVTIEVTDANNNKASSVSIKVATAPPAESSCPIDNEIICMILCAIKPDLPWCNQVAYLPAPGQSF